MWELDYKEGWALKNWCFWTVVLEKTLESPLDCKEIQPGRPKEKQSWLQLQYFGHLMQRADSFEKTLLLLKDWGQEEKGTMEDEMVRWDHWLNGHGFGWTPGVGDGQGGLAFCDSWGRKESDTTERLNWTQRTESSWFVTVIYIFLKWHFASNMVREYLFKFEANLFPLLMLCSDEQRLSNLEWSTLSIFYLTFSLSWGLKSISLIYDQSFKVCCHF